MVNHGKIASCLRKLPVLMRHVGKRTGYKIVDRLGLSAEIIPHMLGTNRLPLGVRGMYCYWRTGAAVVAQNALRYLEVK